MDSSSSPAPPGPGAGAERDHSEDHEMTDAPAHTYTKSQFVLPSSAATSPEPQRDTEPAPRVLETTEKPAILGKKKGQAAIKKAPKRGKGGTNGSKPAKKAVKKVAASDASADSAAEAEAEPEGADSDEGDESDNGPYCICRGPDDHRFMIGCDVCEDWFHGECVGIDKDVGEHLIERFVCPNCSNRETGVLTVFKKTCGLPKCKKPARLYDGLPKEKRSHFCSAEHKQLWWERCLSTLPKKKDPSSKVPEPLTQAEFVAILESGLATFQNNNNNNNDDNSGSALPAEDEIMSDSINNERANGQEEPQLPKEPQPNLPEGQQPTLTEVEELLLQVNAQGLTEEQQQLVNHLSSERKRLAGEVVLHMQMIFVVDWVNARRKKLVAAEMLDDAACGYDYRLDSVGAPEPFKQWLHSPAGRALFEGIPHGKGPLALGPDVPLSADPKDICDKKRCKAHQGWYALLKRDLNLHMYERQTVIGAHADRMDSIENPARERLKRLKSAKAAHDKVTHAKVSRL